MTDPTIAKTIIEQMGGAGKIRAMVGVKTFVVSEDGVSIEFNGSRKMNCVKITLDPSDTYTMTLYKLMPKKMELKKISEIDGLFWDQLKPVFENETGLYLSF
jgi:hypothetical protein